MHKVTQASAGGPLTVVAAALRLSVSFATALTRPPPQGNAVAQMTFSMSQLNIENPLGHRSNPPRQPGQGGGGRPRYTTPLDVGPTGRQAPFFHGMGIGRQNEDDAEKRWRQRHAPIRTTDGEILYSADFPRGLWNYVFPRGEQPRRVLSTIEDAFGVDIEAERPPDATYFILWAQPRPESQFRQNPQQLSNIQLDRLNKAGEFLVHYKLEAQDIAGSGKKGPTIEDFWVFYSSPQWQTLSERLGPPRGHSQVQASTQPQIQAAGVGKTQNSPPPAPSQSNPVTETVPKPQTLVASASGPARQNASSSSGSTATAPTGTPAAGPTKPTPKADQATPRPEPAADPAKEIKKSTAPYPYQVDSKNNPVLATAVDMVDLHDVDQKEAIRLATRHNDKIREVEAVSTPGKIHRVETQEEKDQWDRSHKDARQAEHKADILRLAQIERETRYVIDEITGKRVTFEDWITAHDGRLRAQIRSELSNDPALVGKIKTKLWTEFCKHHDVDPASGPPGDTPATEPTKADAKVSTTSVDEEEKVERETPAGTATGQGVTPE